MKLPAWAEADDKGHSTYPEGLCGQFLAKTLHLHEPGAFALAVCGTITEGPQGYLGARKRRVRVCSKCRRIADGDLTR